METDRIIDILWFLRGIIARIEADSGSTKFYTIEDIKRDLLQFLVN